MGMTPGELQRLAEDILGDRMITANLYCANCAYNLRTLPYRGRCPECGSEYNARTLWKEGVFTARMLVFPTGDCLAATVSLALGAGLVAAGIRPAGAGLGVTVGWPLLAGLIFLVLGGVYVSSTWRRVARYVHFRAVARRIEASERD